MRLVRLRALHFFAIVDDDIVCSDYVIVRHILLVIQCLLTASKLGIPDKFNIVLQFVRTVTFGLDSLVSVAHLRISHVLSAIVRTLRALFSPLVWFLCPHVHLTCVKSSLSIGLSSNHFSSDLILFLRTIGHFFFQVDAIAEFANPIRNFAVLGSLGPNSELGVVDRWRPREVPIAGVVGHNEIFARFVAFLRFGQRLTRMLMVRKVSVQSRSALACRANWTVLLAHVRFDRFPLRVILWGLEVGTVWGSLLFTRRIERYSVAIVAFFVLDFGQGPLAPWV